MKKTYNNKYKSEVVLELLKGTKSLTELAGEKGVHVNVISRWRSEAVSKFPLLFEEINGKELKTIKEQEATIKELYSQIGELSTKLHWLKKKSGIDI